MPIGKTSTVQRSFYYTYFYIPTLFTQFTLWYTPPLLWTLITLIFIGWYYLSSFLLFFSICFCFLGIPTMLLILSRWLSSCCFQKMKYFGGICPNIWLIAGACLIHSYHFMTCVIIIHYLCLSGYVLCTLVSWHYTLREMSIFVFSWRTATSLLILFT